MSYVKNHLLKNEQVIFLRQPHRVVFFVPVVLLIVAIVVAMGLIGGDRFNVQLYGMSLYHWGAVIIFLYGFFTLIGAYLQYRFSEYAVTNKRILIKAGLVKRVSLEIFLDKIEAILVDQTIAGRLLNYGRLMVVGTGGSRDSFLYVPTPLAFRRKIQEQIDEYVSKK